MTEIEKLIAALNKIAEELNQQHPVEEQIPRVLRSKYFRELIVSLINHPMYDPKTELEFQKQGKVAALPILRKMRGCFSQPTVLCFSSFAEIAEILIPSLAPIFRSFLNKLQKSNQAGVTVKALLCLDRDADFYQNLTVDLEKNNPHALFPTSPYRESEGSVVSSSDDHTIEAVMTHRSFTSIRIEENVLETSNPILSDVYSPLGRCVCLVDKNVEESYGSKIDKYFSDNGIILHKFVYRAMEIDKTLASVEKMLHEFKNLSVARHEPVLIIGGGVLADIGGLACALFNRNTPYIMVGSSIVSAIDAGPSPRTCCDGFGYKNLTGAYHAPILTITDKSFFKTLRKGWLRHGVAEIIKMAIVKDAKLFEQLEKIGIDLIETKFGTVSHPNSSAINDASREILAGAMRSYVESEYGNLYETHQCRPHAYGHTWSPGFELQSGLLHGHAVSIGMGFGAFLSWKRDWLGLSDLNRILNLITDYELSLWHKILLDEELIWNAQTSITDKRGGNLAAPVPKGCIGECGYINELTRTELRNNILEYQSFCNKFARNGHGIEPLCSDVGLENPADVLDINNPTKAA